MLLVTDKYIPMHERLLEKLDLMATRVVKHKFDCLLILDGDEGMGKSNLASAIAYYWAWKTKRNFSNKNVFFKIEDMLEFAKSTERQVIWWDEAALGGLTSQGFNQLQIQLLQVLMTARKKQNFYIFVIPKYYRLKRNIIDRSMGLVHVYSRDQITRGRFAYYNKDKLEKMFDYWKKTNDKGYKKFLNFHGEFKATLPLVIDEKEYDRKKDEAIMSIGVETKESKFVTNLREENKKIKYIYSTTPGLTRQELADRMGVSLTCIKTWRSDGVDRTAREYLDAPKINGAEEPDDEED